MAEPKDLRRRFWLEIALGSVTGYLFVQTLVWRDWIEAVFGWDPDRHSGSVEWLLVGALAVVTVAFLVLARVEWRSRRRPGQVVLD